MSENRERIAFLHIGWPKTGTSTLQIFFAQNMERLKAAGCSYPELFDLSAAKRGDYGQGNAYSLVYQYLPDKSLTNCTLPEFFFEDLGHHLSYSNGNILLSTEWFTLLEPSVLSELNTMFGVYNYRVKVISYLRRQDRFLDSSYTQGVKMGRELRTPDEFAYVLDYRPCLNKFASVFGDSNIIVRCYEKKQFYGGDIFSDFLNVLGVTDDTAFTKPSSRKNSSPPPEVINLCREARIAGLPQESVRIIYRNANSILPGRKVTWISPRKRNEILKKCATQNQEIAKKYLDRRVLFDMPNLMRNVGKTH